ncbi:hypothetical protein, partial [Sphingomonas bacterium]|uniref:hypothetical protein n=1 Tax=Sphingomonas bacterium TaxID=1895847 RepID=UPI001C2D8AFA
MRIATSGVIRGNAISLHEKRPDVSSVDPTAGDAHPTGEASGVTRRAALQAGVAVAAVAPF